MVSGVPSPGKNSSCPQWSGCQALRSVFPGARVTFVFQVNNTQYKAQRSGREYQLRRNDVGVRGRTSANPPRLQVKTLRIRYRAGSNWMNTLSLVYKGQREIGIVLALKFYPKISYSWPLYSWSIAAYVVVKSIFSFLLYPYMSNNFFFPTGVAPNFFQKHRHGHYFFP